MFIHERHREAETQAEREAGSLQEPDMGLDPGPPGSCPEPKADVQPLSHPGIPKFAVVLNFMTKIVHSYLVEFGYPFVEEWIHLRYSLRSESPH